jgi:hypothetical protein
MNAGMSIRNIGSMTFSGDNNTSTSYELEIDTNQKLYLNEFQDAESLSDIEQVLLQHPEFFTKSSSKEDFKVKLPTTFNVYADFKVYHKFYVTGQMQQRMQDNNGNTQITAQNSYSIIPRINLGFFEAYIPFSNNEISGSNTGFGFRLGGFYLGSGSMITALMDDSKQIDFNMGFRWAFL